MTTIYYKITNTTECHKGYQYTDELNIDTNQFSEMHGLHFTKLKHIHRFYYMGVNIREVFLPVNDPSFKINKNSTTKIWKANMIILGTKLSLLDPDTYSKLNLNIHSNLTNIINILSKKGNTTMLEKIAKLKIKMNYSDWAINYASANGHTEVLDFWKKYQCQTKLKIKYNEWAVNNASARGQINSLDWWVNSGLKFMYDEWAINNASARGQIDVLNWWLNMYLKYKTPLKYNLAAVTSASRNGHVDVLVWWKDVSTKYDIKIKYDKWTVNEASENGQLEILNWWWNQKDELEFMYDHMAITECSRNGYISVLNWWVEKIGIDVVKSFYTKKIITDAKINQHTGIITWWKNLIDQESNEN